MTFPTVRQGAIGLALLMVAVAFAGCSDSGQTTASRGPYTIYVHGDSLLPSGGDDALIEGIVVARDGCVQLGFGKDDTYPVVWPSGTSIADDDPLTLRLRSGGQVTVGQTVRGGGGSHDVASPRVTIDIAERCRSTTGEVLIFNPEIDLDVIT